MGEALTARLNIHFVSIQLMDHFYMKKGVAAVHTHTLLNVQKPKYHEHINP